MALRNYHYLTRNQPIPVAAPLANSLPSQLYGYGLIGFGNLFYFGDLIGGHRIHG